MSRPLPTRLPSGTTLPTSTNRRVSLSSSKSDSRTPTLPVTGARRASVSNLNLNLKTASGPKTQRTSKTSQKLVVLPSAPQTKPFQSDFLHHGYETDNGIRETKSEAERMSKEQRKQAGFKRITAYCVAEAFRMKLLASFLKREHNVFPRVFDEALYVVSFIHRLSPVHSRRLAHDSAGVDVSFTTFTWLWTQLECTLLCTTRYPRQEVIHVSSIRSRGERVPRYLFRFCPVTYFRKGRLHVFRVSSRDSAPPSTQ